MNQETILMDKNKTDKRMYNLEFLRVVAMLMVVVLHYLGKGNLLCSLTENPVTGYGLVAWGIEAFCIVAVNVYMLISGYFLCESGFKLSRLLKLLLQIWTYSVGIGVLAVLLGLVPAAEVNTYYYLQLLFPVGMEHYWFLTAYVYFYILLPLLGKGVRDLTKKQHRIVLAILLLFFSIGKTVLPFRFTMDKKGYDVLWYICVFVLAAYLRKFGGGVLEKKGRGILLFLLGTALNLAEMFALAFAYSRTGHFEGLLGVSMEYNHLFPLVASLGLFGAFLGIPKDGKVCRTVGKLGGLTLGVYLLHENLGLRYVWQEWFGASKVDSVFLLLGTTVLAAVGMFALGICVEKVRLLAMQGLHKLLLKAKPYCSLMNLVNQADEAFAQK